MEDSLTIREQEILREIVYGASNKEIAKKMYVSLSTVKAHVSSIIQKMKVKNRIDVAVRGVFILNFSKNDFHAKYSDFI